MIFCLPLLFADGRFTSLDRITVKQLEKFIPFMVSCSVGREKPLGSIEPIWWPSDLPFSIPLKKPHSVRHKWLALLKSLVCRCYTYHGCEFMLRFCTDLTNTPNSVLTYVDTWNDTVSVYSKKTGKLVVTFRSENMTYDKTPEITEGQIYGNNKTENEVLCDNTHFLDIYVCEMCDFTFPNLEAAQEHEEMCRVDSSHVPLVNNHDQLASEQERFLDYLGLRSNMGADVNVHSKSTSNDVSLKHAGVNFARCCSIPLSSPLGLALHRRTKPSTVSSEVHLCKVERHCVDHTELLLRTREARHSDGTWPTTWKRNKTSTNVWAHIYKFPRKHLRCRPPVPDTGYSAESLKLLQLCRPLSVILHKLERGDIHHWSNKIYLETLNTGVELQTDTSSENLSDDYSSSFREKLCTTNCLTSSNSHCHPGEHFTHDAVTSQLICQPKSAEVKPCAESTENSAQVNRNYSCESEQSRRLTVLGNVSPVPETPFSRLDGQDKINTSPNEGSVYSSLEPFSPQSVATILDHGTAAGQIGTTKFSRSQEIAPHNRLEQHDSPSLHIPEAQTLELYPLKLQSSILDHRVKASQPACEYRESQLISYILPQKLISHVPQPELDHQVPPPKKIRQSAQIPVCPSQLYPSVITPLLPLTTATPVICAAVTQKSFMESESINCNYPVVPIDVCSPLTGSVSSKHRRSGTLFANHINKPSEEQLIFQEHVQENNILLTSGSLNDTHTIYGGKVTPISCSTEELGMQENIKQKSSGANMQYTRKSFKRSVSVNAEYEELPCTSALVERETVPMTVSPVPSIGADFRRKLISSDENCISSLHSPDLVLGSVTYANNSRTNSGFVVQGNKAYHNCLETSEAQCEQRLLFKSTPAETSMCSMKSLETSVKSIENKFPKKHKRTVNKNMEKLSREVQRLMKDECVSIRDKQFFKILNCDYKVLRKREIGGRCTNRVNKIKHDIVKPFRMKSFKAYKYFSTCKVSSGVRNSFHFDVVGSVEEINSKEPIDVTVKQGGKSSTYCNQTQRGKSEQRFTRNSASVKVNHKIQNSLSMHYEVQSIQSNSVEVKLSPSNSMQETCFQHCGKLESFHQYSLTSVINEAEHSRTNYSDTCHEDVTVNPISKPEKVLPFVSDSDTPSGSVTNICGVDDIIGRSKRRNCSATCEMKLRSQCESGESVSFMCTSARSHRVTHNMVDTDTKCFVCPEKQKLQKNKIMKHLNQQMSLKTQFTDVYRITLQGSSRTQPSENEGHCEYMHFSSSSRIRIFTKKQIVGKEKKRAVSRELKQLLQDECKELVNLGLERTNVPVKTSSKVSTLDNILISQLREIEEYHREWFKDQDVMCVINFPYEFRSI